MIVPQRRNKTIDSSIIVVSTAAIAINLTFISQGGSIGNMINFCVFNLLGWQLPSVLAVMPSGGVETAIKLLYASSNIECQSGNRDSSVSQSIITCSGGASGVIYFCMSCWLFWLNTILVT